MPEHASDVVIDSPANPAELEAYYELRWRLLRAPWDQPRGSERDELEGNACHRLARSGEGEVIGVARLHLLDEDTGQIRYLAVDEKWRRHGIGTRLLAALEQEARALGVRRVVARVREGARAFYAGRGYLPLVPGPTLFGSIRHFKMVKPLPPA